MGKKLTQEKFEDQVYKKYNGMFSVVGKYVDWKTPIEIKCNNCGNVFSKKPNSITAKGRTVRCPECEGKYISSITNDKNDLWATHPDIACLLEDSEIGHKYRHASDHETCFVCPDCGHRQIAKIKNITKRGFKCKCCGSVPYYPNQFLYNLLDYAGVSFNAEYNLPGSPYRYDAHFQYNNKDYLVEMDGAYGHGCVNTPNRTIDKQIYDDDQKDIIAINNDMIIIRVDCKYSGSNDRFEYVKNSIKNSELQKLFNFSDEQFVEADRMANISKVKRFVSYWNDGIHSYDELCELLHKCRASVRKLIKISCDLNLIKEPYDEALHIVRLYSNHKLSVSKGTPVVCNETGETYDSMSQAERLTGIKTIRNYFYKHKKYAGILSDGTKLTWSKLEKAV